ncbi:aminotransferase class IV [Vulcanococcus sp.]|jgi:4-amino-4-deoxychorismate lyase|uniref:aminotransferase class IV n=1 Tax=Vulcanococcus sp. TaxID=2856995 RepID=UPI0037D9FFBF
MSPRSIAWFEGHWGEPQQLRLPLSDRGLQLADGLFETVLVLDGRPHLLEAHLQRWQRSAELLAMAPPPEASALHPLIKEAIQRAELPDGSGALRLNWSRGDGSGRGIELPDPAAPHRFWLQLTPHEPNFSPLAAIVSRQERRNSNSLLSRCKTFAYGQAIQARLEAHRAGADEALLLASGGELCCSTTANLLIRRQGQWLTPALSSGCLPGVMRAQLIERGLAEEANLSPTPQPGDSWLLINSLGCRPLSRVDSHPLELHPSAAALWRSLL